MSEQQMQETARPRDEGGAAFPTEAHHWGYNYGTEVCGTPASPGMTLRDYFAIHCDQPGQAEIIHEAGFSFVNSYTIAIPAAGEGPGKEMRFEDWWRSLTQDRRFELYAKVRYGMADAMLAARTTAPASAEQKVN